MATNRLQAAARADVDAEGSDSEDEALTREIKGVAGNNTIILLTNY